ncbi:Protein CLEC-53 [Aphelenchoides avenae]|nr:Protein CLEC-53 [Aphelenchus avenae]
MASKVALAEGRCKAESGHLATVGSALTNSFLARVTGNVAPATQYWLGGAWNAQTAGAWSWADGSPWSYTNWDTRQPIKGPVCLAVNVSTGKWTSEDCSRSKSYICQIPPANHLGGATPPPNLPSPPPPSRCVAGWTYLNDTNLCYLVQSSNSYNWGDAKTLCSGLGGGLVSIPNFSVNMEILSLVLNTQPSQDYVVIGNSYNATSRTWQWTDGSANTYSYWASGYPQQAYNYPCSYMKLAAPIGVWQNAGCYSSSYAVICERESFDI